MTDVLVDKRSDGVAVVTMNRPETLNALGLDLQQALAECLPPIADDPEVRCVVLTGAGRAFCAGGDVKAMAERAARLAAGVHPSAAEFAADLRELRANQLGSSYVLYTMPKPVIAMIGGVAVGAGLSLALACDLRVSSDQARFGTAFRNVGLSGDFGGAYLLPRIVGAGRARELYLSGELVDAERALAIGLVNRIVPHDRLEAETMELAARLAAGPTLAYARMKENLALAAHSDLCTVLDHEALNMRLTGLSEDFQEGALAFTEKRSPTFQGR